MPTYVYDLRIRRVVVFVFDCKIINFIVVFLFDGSCVLSYSSKYIELEIKRNKRGI